MTKDSLTIRARDRTHDRAALLDLVVEHQDYHRAIEPGWPPGRLIARQYLEFLEHACEVEDGTLLVAQSGDRLVGFACVVARQAGAPDNPGPWAFLYDLFVSPAFRRRGIAGRLLARAEAFAHERGATALRLAVLERNADARAFYARTWFDDYARTLTKRLVSG